MIQYYLVLWTVLYSFAHQSRGIFAILSDLETTMTSSWLIGDWPTEKSPQEIVTDDKSSGCICRLKPDHHIVCYGATTCSSFPRNVKLPSGIYDLRLKTTNIYKLSAGELKDFKSLRKLVIDANFRLNEMEPGFFDGMSRIINMSISFNTELKYLHEQTFRGLDNLKHLKLIKNGFRNILDVSVALKPSIVPKIRSLSLSENVFKEIDEASFSGMKGTEISELDLILCQIEKIHPNAIRLFEKLEKLRMGGNTLNEEQLQLLFENMANENIPLKLLNLYELGFRKGTKLTLLLKTIAKLNVTHLNLRRNHIESLYEGLFPFMPHLRTLDLREVSALDVEPNAFNQFLMPKLETLLLGGNKFSGVMSGVLLPQLLDLDLSANTGIGLIPSYFDVNSNIFENMTRLISLNLSFNRVAAISNATFNGVHNLKILGLKKATIFFIAENSFSTLPNLLLLNLEENPYRPFNTFPDLIFTGLERLEILLLSNCQITHFIRVDIFQSLTVLKYLNLQGNGLMRLDPRLFRPLPHLTGLDLTSNQLTPWDYPNGLFSCNVRLKILLLSQNRFTYLTGIMMDDFINMSRLDISMNPYVCDSILMDTTNAWFSARNFTWNETTNLFDVSNVCLSPDEWRDRPLIQFLNSGEIFVSQPAKPSVGKYVTIALLTCFLILTFSLIFYYRSHVRYWIFLLKILYLRRKIRVKNNPKFGAITYSYDAFVSYSHEDRNFVVRLVSMLENEEPFLKLCVYERDFEIGTIISETVMNKVNASRKIVFVVSEAFAKSQWCIWELQLAEYHRLYFRTDYHRECDNDSLIMIKLGPVMSSSMTPMLKYMLRTRIYLEWSSDNKKEKIFWSKLRNCLLSSAVTENAGQSK